MQFPLRLSHQPATILRKDIAPGAFRSYWPRRIGYGSFQRALSFFVGNLPRPHQPVQIRHWVRGVDSNHRPQAYETCELPTALPRDVLRKNGAGDRARTGTGVFPRDFKSRASANSATPAYGAKRGTRTLMPLPTAGFEPAVSAIPPSWRVTRPHLPGIGPSLTTSLLR